MKKITKTIIVYVLIFACVITAAYFMKNANSSKPVKISYSKLTSYLSKDDVKSIKMIGRSYTGKLQNGDEFETYVNSAVESDYLAEKYIFPAMEQGKIKVSSDELPKRSIWVELIPTLILLILLIIFFAFMYNKGGGRSGMSFGKSRAKLHKNENLRSLTFKDIAGLDEEKEELEEIVDFLKNPVKYDNLGARIPKGILLVGPPGTGKTYISRATAGEASVPFFTISGSEFVEMFVGVGASRVRDLFDQAKKNSPCIIFIDEIDAVGRKRGAGLGGGHDEREQTLNQLLVEMDGFGKNNGIIILAATNRPDVLDPALLRPGRFDRQIVIGIPDIKAREAIFKIHSKNKPMADEVEPRVLARRTPGFTPADIENMLNEAALITARRNGLNIRMEEVEEAITKVIAGPEKKSRVISEEDRRLTAYHEAGHAIIGQCLPKIDPVHQITIVPRGMAGGFTMNLPTDDKTYVSKESMREEIVMLLGGRVSELLIIKDVSTGASNDIERATDIARSMVTKYGFSDSIGAINYSSSQEVFLGNDFSSKQPYSESTAYEIDMEVKKIIDMAYQEAIDLLSSHMDVLHQVADALLRVETLSGEQFVKLFNKEITSEELAEEVSNLEKKKQEENKEEAKVSKNYTEEILKKSEDTPASDLSVYDTNYFDEDSSKKPEEVEEDKENK